MPELAFVEPDHVRAVDHRHRHGHSVELFDHEGAGARIGGVDRFVWDVVARQDQLHLGAVRARVRLKNIDTPVAARCLGGRRRERRQCNRHCKTESVQIVLHCMLPDALDASAIWWQPSLCGRFA